MTPRSYSLLPVRAISYLASPGGAISEAKVVPVAHKYARVGLSLGLAADSDGAMGPGGAVMFALPAAYASARIDHRPPLAVNYRSVNGIVGAMLRTYKAQSVIITVLPGEAGVGIHSSQSYPNISFLCYSEGLERTRRADLPTGVAVLLAETHLGNQDRCVQAVKFGLVDGGFSNTEVACGNPY